MPTANPPLSVQPYLFFGGRCEEALEFYGKAVGAKIEMFMRYKESPQPPAAGTMPECFEEKVMHSSFSIGESTLLASDGMCDGKPNFEGFSLSLVAPEIGRASCRERV